MKTGLPLLKQLILASIFFLIIGTASAQTMEWQLVKSGESSTDPDGVGPAIGTVSFTLQIHSVSGSVSNINTISTGYSYQSSSNMVPGNPGCPATVNNPANITVGAAFPGWSFNAVNQCGIAAQTTASKIFDRRAVGTFEGSNVTITTAWVDMFTVTLWALGTPAVSGYVIVNSGEGGSPGEFTTYTVSDQDGNSIAANSLTYTTPLFVGPPLPVGLSKFDITCTGNGAQLNWQTLTEQNSSNFEIEKSMNGATGWTTIGSSIAAGNSLNVKQYQYFDLKGGTAYYRLRQVDKDGRFTYSNVQNVNCLTKFSNILVYPVPARNKLNVVLETGRSSKATIVLVDVSGKMVSQQRADLQKGMNNLSIEVAGLSSGQYYLKVLGSDMFSTQKVTIIK